MTAETNHNKYSHFQDRERHRVIAIVSAYLERKSSLPDQSSAVVRRDPRTAQREIDWANREIQEERVRVEQAIESAASALGRMRETAEVALPELVDLLDGDRSAEVRRTAAWALGQIGKGAAAASSKLILALADQVVQEHAAETLGRLGPLAISAVPQLRELVAETQTNQFVRLAAERACQKIAVAGH